MLKINGVAIAAPKSFEVSIGDIDGESNRTANGDMLRDRIAIKRKISLEWPPLSQEEISPILTALSAVFFTVEFQDPQLGVTTKTMYVGDRSSQMYCYINGVAKWQGLKMNFIEK